MSTDYSQVRKAIYDALADSLPSLDEQIAIKWVLAAEVIDDDGQKSLIEVSDAEFTAWDIVGMLTTVLWKYQQRTVFIPEGGGGDE